MPFRNSLVGNLNANLKHQQQKKELLKKKQAMLNTYYAEHGMDEMPSAAGNQNSYHDDSVGNKISREILGGDSASELWRMYRNRTKFNLTLHCSSCRIKLSNHTGITR